MAAMLAGRGLTLIRGDRCLFRDLDFELGAGETLLVEGPNGSGKTSLLRVVAGLIPPEEGEVSWRGRPTGADRQAYHAELAWLAHRPGCKGDLTLTENLRFESGLRRMRREELPSVLQRLGLGKVADLPFRVLSAGQQRRVALARLVLAATPLWLLDEPFTNLDREGRGLVEELLRTHLAGGGLCIVASHQPPVIPGTPHRVALR